MKNKKIEKSRKISFPLKVILLVNLIVAFSLFLANLAAIIPPDKLYLFAFFGLVYDYLLFANIAFVIIWIPLRWKFSLLSFIIILLGFQNVTSAIHFGGKEFSEESNLKIMTFNAKSLTNSMGKKRGIENVDKIVSAVNGFAPDIVCLQEFSNLEGQNTSFLNKFSDRINLKRYHYQKYYGKNRRGDLKAIVTLSRFPIVNRQAVEQDGRRVAMFTDLIVENDTIRVFNLHLQSIKLSSKDIDAVNDFANIETSEEIEHSVIFTVFDKLKTAFQKRAIQARKVKKVINESPYPTIVCGDFNDTPASYTYRQIRKGLEDSFVEEGRGFGNTFNGKLPSIRIDYVLHDNSFSAHSFKVDNSSISDHYPVMVGLKY